MHIQSIYTNYCTELTIDAMSQFHKSIDSSTLLLNLASFFFFFPPFQRLELLNLSFKSYKMVMTFCVKCNPGSPAYPSLTPTFTRKALARESNFAWKVL